MHSSPYFTLKITSHNLLFWKYNNSILHKHLPFKLYSALGRLAHPFIQSKAALPRCPKVNLDSFNFFTVGAFALDTRLEQCCIPLWFQLYLILACWKPGITGEPPYQSLFLTNAASSASDNLPWHATQLNCKAKQVVSSHYHLAFTPITLGSTLPKVLQACIPLCGSIIGTHCCTPSLSHHFMQQWLVSLAAMANNLK